jgi:hypothetical protein
VGRTNQSGIALPYKRLNTQEQLIEVAGRAFIDGVQEEYRAQSTKSDRIEKFGDAASKQWRCRAPEQRGKWTAAIALGISENRHLGALFGKCDCKVLEMERLRRSTRTHNERRSTSKKLPH